MTRQNPPLDPSSFDALTGPRDKLWGLSSISAFLGVSRDKARRLAQQPACPIYRPEGSGQYFALRTELTAWLRSKK